MENAKNRMIRLGRNLALSFKVNTSINVIYVLTIEPSRRVVQSFVLFCANNLVADQKVFAFHQRVKLLRYVRNGPIDKLLEPRHKVLIEYYEEQTNGEDFPVEVGTLKSKLY